MEGIFAVYKPKGITSHDMIYRVRKATGERRVGHAGTLDPLAEGVLVVAVGRENTKKLSEVVAKEKEYRAEIFLGKTSTTDDDEGTKTAIAVGKAPSVAEVKNVLQKFVGTTEQVPPAYSALKINGATAYSLARKGTSPEMKPRPAEIKRIELLEYTFPIMKINVITGPGVYIRALARDVGAALNTGGYLYSLVRTRVGEFAIGDCKKLTSEGF